MDIRITGAKVLTGGELVETSVHIERRRHSRNRLGLRRVEQRSMPKA